MTRNLTLPLAFATVLSTIKAVSAARVAAGEEPRELVEDRGGYLGSLVEVQEKEGLGDNATFHISIANGNSIGRLHLGFAQGARLTSEGFATTELPAGYWPSGSILGK